MVAARRYARFFKAPAFVAGFDDLAVVGEPVEQCSCHLGIAEDAGPFPQARLVVTMIEVRK